jgi:hypothetical protein
MGVRAARNNSGAVSKWALVSVAVPSLGEVTAQAL